MQIIFSFFSSPLVCSFMIWPQYEIVPSISLPFLSRWRRPPTSSSWTSSPGSPSHAAACPAAAAAPTTAAARAASSLPPWWRPVMPAFGLVSPWSIYWTGSPTTLTICLPASFANLKKGSIWVCYYIVLLGQKMRANCSTIARVQSYIRHWE